MTATSTLWGGVVALQRGDPATLASGWAARNGLRRLLLIADSGPEAGGESGCHALADALERAGVAVFAFEAPAGATVAAVGEGVGAYHFDACDGLLALGGAAAVDLSKVVAMMAGQRHPIPALAEDPSLIDARASAPLLALATSLDGVAACGGSALLLDDGGTPLLLRDVALRPGSAAYCPTAVDPARSAAVVAALLLDAAATSPDEAAETRRIVDVLVTTDGAEATLAAALQAAGVLERWLGPARVLAAMAEVVAGLPPADALSALLGPACAGVPELEDVVAAVVSALAADPVAGGMAVEHMALDGLALAQLGTLPVDLAPLLRALGREIPAHRRRGGRAAINRSRRPE